jgi:hypothetical protein
VQNLAYALIQVLHNLGAATILGATASAVWLVRGNQPVHYRLAQLVAAAWAIQAATGLMFGATTYLHDRQLPDIHGVAVAALVIKVTCAVTGFILAIIYIRSNSEWPEAKRSSFWVASFTVGFVALGSAAFLRWFS